MASDTTGPPPAERVTDQEFEDWQVERDVFEDRARDAASGGAHR